LYDDAFSVRTSTVRQIAGLIRTFGPEWAVKTLVPSLQKTLQNRDYLLRQTVVQAVGEIAQFQGLIETALALLEEAASDPVGNVRLVVAKIMPETARTILRRLENDADPDVRDVLQSRGLLRRGSSSRF
jgi:serine/threonine-protein phosphatase 2A regulatory subunit A